jgi:spermidine synthase
VIRLARSHFSVPPDDARLAIHRGDAARFVAEAGGREQWGVIQADVYDSQARGPVCDSLAFYRACRAALDPAGGILVVNLFGETASYARNLSRIARAFEARVLVLPAVPAENVVVLAFSGPPLEVPLAAFRARAATVERRWRLPAKGWAEEFLGDPARRSSAAHASVEGPLVV